MTILLSQALPYRNNKENAQVGYAAESGLEVARQRDLHQVSGGEHSAALAELDVSAVIAERIP